MKGKTRRKHTKTESNWREYTSSSDDVNSDIKKYGIDNFKFEIIEIYKTRSETNYAELEMQVNLRVLSEKDEDGEYIFYNKNIISKFFRRD